MLFSCVKAIPAGIFVGIVTFFLMRLYQKRTGRIIEKRRRTAIVLSPVYIMFVLQVTVFLRQFGSIYEIDLIPFDRPGGIRYIILYALANAVIFIPLGVLNPIVCKKMQSMRLCFLAGFLFSCLIESMQLLLGCGRFQTEDIIMNTVGEIIGYVIWRTYK